MKNKLLTSVFALALIVMTITFSIGLPIYVRPFYYAHINALDMPEETGYDYDTIKEAYDEVLDYLTVPGNEFGTGELLHSEEGASHFADCKVLFDLNLWGYIVSSVLVVALVILSKKGVFSFTRAGGLGVSFWSGISALFAFALVGGLAALDFDRAFVIFHSIFFPGKDNWMFNPRTDQIIQVMPEEFFMNCAILIVSSIIVLCLTYIIVGIVRRERKGK